MKRKKLVDLDLKAIVETELENRNCDGLYSPCKRCECGCSRTKLFSCAKACADCRPGLQHPGTSDLKIVSHDEYCEIIDRIKAEHKRNEEKLRAEAIEKRKAERLGAKQIKEENALKKKQVRTERNSGELINESSSLIASMQNLRSWSKIFQPRYARVFFANFSVAYRSDRLSSRLHLSSSLRLSSMNGWLRRQRQKRLQPSIYSKSCLCLRQSTYSLS